MAPGKLPCYGCATITVLKKPREAEALALLKRVALVVGPVMQKHKWSVDLLTEFYPDDRGLLGMNRNRGEVVYVRLRPADDESTFLEFDDLVGTMLHELTHNVFGPHDDKFYKLLEEIKLEVEMDPNFRALGGGGSYGTRIGGPTRAEAEIPVFQGQGNVLGGRPAATAKSAAAAAAEARNRSGVSGQRLGGSKTAKPNSTPGQMAAAAAERRRLDAIVCGTIDLTLDDDDANHGGGQSSSANKRPAPPTNEQTSKRIKPEPQSTASRQNQDKGWVCTACTFENKPLWLQCNVCLTERVL